jgi:hypothetical protein
MTAQVFVLYPPDCIIAAGFLIMYSILVLPEYPILKAKSIPELDPGKIQKQ